MTLGEIIEAVLRRPLVAQLICVDDWVDDTRAILEEARKRPPKLRHSVAGAACARACGGDCAHR
jgi:hypothetical protein